MFWDRGMDYESLGKRLETLNVDLHCPACGHGDMTGIEDTSRQGLLPVIGMPGEGLAVSLLVCSRSVRRRSYRPQEWGTASANGELL